MGRVGRFAGLLILAGLLLCSLESSAFASPQASKTPLKGAFPKDGAAKSGSQKASTSKENEETAKDSGKKSAKKMTRAEKKEAAIAEARAAVKEMIRKLGKGEYQEFMHQHIPIDEYVRGLRNGRPMEIPVSAIPQMIQIAATLERLQDGEATIDPTGRVVTLTAKEESTIPKVINNPYSGEADAVSAYKGSLSDVIAAAIEDLSDQEFEKTLERLLPPSTIHMMKTDGRWDAMVASLTPESEMIMSMQAELQALLSLKPVIDGDTAEFRVPRIIHVVKNKSLFEGTSGDLEEEEVGERLIRFSRINGAWRFFDGNAATNVELEAALTRQAPMEISDNELVVEKIGSDWRLFAVPGMPPVRPVQ